MEGVHIFSSFLDCECGKEILTNYQTVEEQIRNSIERAGLTVIGLFGKNFESETEQWGYSLIFPLLESHISIHTFPEESGLLVDVFACHFRRNNTDRAEKVYEDLKSLYLPREIQNHQQIQR